MPYDEAQICINGHVITAEVSENRDKLKNFCPQCGANTISNCQKCNAKIQGSHWFEHTIHGFNYTGSYSLPLYCYECGAEYPWTETKIQTAIQMFLESGQLDEKEKATIEEDVKNIAREIPQSELSAMRIKRIWDKGSKIAYRVIMEFASKTASEYLKN